MAYGKLEHVLTKYNWAKKRVDEFDSVVEAFSNSNPHSVGRKVDTQRGEITYFVKEAPAVSDELRLRFGDAIHNLRSTLDYLIRLLIFQPGSGEDTQTGFPIFDTPETYRASFSRKVVGLRQECIEILHSVQPYRGGWGNILWQLHKLDIINKHRLLVAICTMNVARTATPSEISILNRKNRNIANMDNVLLPTYWLDTNASPRLIPLHTGYELKTVPISEVDKQMGFAFDVAIHEPDVLVGVPTYLFLRDACNQVFSCYREVRRLSVDTRGPFRRVVSCG